MNTPGPFGRFLSRSLEAVSREVPRAWRALGAALAGRAVRLTVDGETLVAAGDGAAVTLRAPRDGESFAVTLRTSHEAIVALVDGRRTLVESVLAGELDLRGTVEEIAVFHDALQAYLHGAVRSVSHPPLLRSYRASAERTTRPAEGDPR